MKNFVIQKKIINEIKNYNKKISKVIDPSISPYSYMTPWAETLGYYQLQKILNNFKLSQLNFLFKDYMSASTNMSGFRLSKRVKDYKIKNYPTLIISYCQKKNFKQGFFYDQYFNFSSKKKNYLWFLISLDNYIPKKISNNVVIFFNEKSAQNSKFSFLLFIIKYLFKNNYGVKNFPHWANSSFYFAEQIKKQFKNFFNFKTTKKVIINFEAIPFQHVLINEIKKMNKRIKIFCYLHCAGWPFQSDLIYRNKKIDLLFVSGVDQLKNCKKYLNWPKKKLRNIPSLRFSKSEQNDFSGQIFVPYEIINEKKNITNLGNFLKNSDDFSLNKFNLRIHPLNMKSKKHENFKKNIQKLLTIYKNKFSKKKVNKISIVFGSVTGITVQALESGVEVIHFPNDHRIDVFNEVMWPNIKIKNFGGVYSYTLKKKNMNFWVKQKKPNFEKCFKL